VKDSKLRVGMRKGEVFAYVGRIQNLKGLKDASASGSKMCTMSSLKLRVYLV
jgi:hypothetical protein